MTSLLIQHGTLVRSTGETKADLLIENGIIKTIAPALQTKNQKLKTDKTIDATNLLVLPGLIDCHVHFREPGLEQKATMATEAAAAIAGGVTTVCEMPNTIPPTVTIAALADKVRRASSIERCDIRFFFGVTEAAHLVALRELWTGTSEEIRRLKKQCCGVKLYLDHSTGNQKIEGGILDEAFKTCAELGIVVVCHCEDPEINARFPERPPESEAKAIADAITLAHTHGTHLHVAHLSTKQGLDLIRKAKKAKLSVTCEVAPHHLFLTTEDYKKLGALGKMNPPLRSADHVDALWKGIEDRTIDCAATDHAPHTLEEKMGTEVRKPPTQAPSGVPGVETVLPLLLSKIPPSEIVRLCFEHPNRIFSLGKQGIAEGAPANIVLVDPNARWVIRGAEPHSKCGWTPYEGWKVRGKVRDVR